MNNQLFSLSRCFRLAGITSNRNYAQYVLFAVVYILAMLLNGTLSFTDSAFYPITLIMTVVFIIVFFSIENKTFRGKAEKFNFINSPYSAIEKFINTILIKVVLFTCIYFGTIGILNQLMEPLRLELQLVMPSSYSVFALASNIEILNAFFFVSLIIIGISSIGSVAFKRNAILYNFIIIIITLFLFFIISVFIDKITVSTVSKYFNISSRSVMNEVFELIVSPLWSILLTLFLLLIAYFKIKEIEA